MNSMILGADSAYRILTQGGDTFTNLGLGISDLSSLPAGYLKHGDTDINQIYTPVVEDGEVVYHHPADKIGMRSQYRKVQLLEKFVPVEGTTDQWSKVDGTYIQVLGSVLGGAVFTKINRDQVHEWN